MLIVVEAGIALSMAVLPLRAELPDLLEPQMLDQPIGNPADVMRQERPPQSQPAGYWADSARAADFELRRAESARC